MPSLISRKSILDTELSTKEAQINAVVFDYVFGVPKEETEILNSIWLDEKTGTLKVNPNKNLKCFDPYDSDNYTGIWSIGYKQLMKLKNLFDITTIEIPSHMCNSDTFLTIDMEGQDLDGFTFIDKIEIINVNKIRNCTFKNMRYGISFTKELEQRTYVLDLIKEPNYKIRLNYDDSKYNNPDYLKENGFLWSDIIDFDTVKFEGTENVGVNINMEFNNPQFKTDFKKNNPYNSSEQYVSKNLFSYRNASGIRNKVNNQLRDNVFKFFYEKHDYLLPFYYEIKKDYYGKDIKIKKCIPFHINHFDEFNIKLDLIDQCFYLGYVSKIMRVPD